MSFRNERSYENACPHSRTDGEITERGDIFVNCLDCGEEL